MKLTIDQIPCDLDPSQRIALDYDAQDLADVRSGNKGHALRLRLPATRTNDRIFGFAAEPYTGQRFNAAQHTAVLSDGEAKLLQGSVRLLSAAYDSDQEGYLIEIRSGTSEWARQVAAEMFNTLGISFSGRLTPTMIRQTWTNNTGQILPGMPRRIHPRTVVGRTDSRRTIPLRGRLPPVHFGRNRRADTLFRSGLHP